MIKGSCTFPIQDRASTQMLTHGAGMGKALREHLGKAINIGPLPLAVFFAIAPALLGLDPAATRYVTARLECRAVCWRFRFHDGSLPGGAGSASNHWSPISAGCPAAAE